MKGKYWRFQLGALLTAVFFIAGCTGNGLNISTRAELMGFFPDGTLQILRKVFTWAGGDTVPVYVCDESVILKVRPMTAEERVRADEVLKDYPRADPPDPFLYYMILDVRFPSEHYYAQNKQCFNEESLKRILVGTTLTELIRAGGFIGGMKLRNPDIFKQSFGQSIGDVAGGAATAFSEGSQSSVKVGDVKSSSESNPVINNRNEGEVTGIVTNTNSVTAVPTVPPIVKQPPHTVHPPKPPVVYPPHPVHPPKPPIINPPHPVHPPKPPVVKPEHPEHPDVPKGPPSHVPGKGSPGDGPSHDTPSVKPTHPEHPVHPDVPKGLPAGQAGPPSQVPGKGIGLDRGNAGDQKLRVWQ